MTRTCYGCAHRNVCGDSSRITPCAGKITEYELKKIQSKDYQKSISSYLEATTMYNATWSKIE